MKYKISLLLLILLPFEVEASREGVPVYYNTEIPNINYRGSNQPEKVLVGQTVSYGPARNNVYEKSDFLSSEWNLENTGWVASIDAGRRYADFVFETGVLSKLSWTNMVFNEVNIGLSKNFDISGYDVLFKANYRYGTMADGGDSYDDDLRTNPLDPYSSLYTISVGQEEGKLNEYKLALGLKNIWDWNGFKFTPYIGYEVFQHKLKMKNHRYPNQGVNVPALDTNGDYIFSDGEHFYSSSDVSDAEYMGYPYQVCLTAHDIPVFHPADLGDPTLTDAGYASPDTEGYTVWGVPVDECILIGGDGELLVNGITHIYDTTWSGFFVGLGMEKQFSIKDKLSVYGQLGIPHYKSDGIWPNRTDWQQNPSFTDEGSGGFSYKLEAEYSYAISPSLKLSVRVDTDYYRKGHTEGTLNLAEYWDYVYDANGDPEIIGIGGNDYYKLQKYSAESIHDKDALNWAEWQSFGLHIGLKAIF